jgi:hypothetical protein
LLLEFVAIDLSSAGQILLKGNVSTPNKIVISYGADGYSGSLTLGSGSIAVTAPHYTKIVDTADNENKATLSGENLSVTGSANAAGATVGTIAPTAAGHDAVITGVYSDLSDVILAKGAVFADS